MIESDPALADCFMWGTAFYTSITKWLSLLQDLPSDPGISLLELLVNWLVCSGMEFPYVVPKGSDAPTNLAKDAYSIRTSAQDISVLLLLFSWCKAVNAFENALRTLQRWSEHPLLPWPPKSKVSTLTCFGAMQKTSGFSR